MRGHLTHVVAGIGALSLLGGAAWGQSLPNAGGAGVEQSPIEIEVAEIDEQLQDPQICVQLSVANLVGGSFAEFQVAGGPPGELTAVLYSLTLGSFAGTTGLWCYDFGLNIPPPPAAAIVVMGPFDGSGIFFDTRFIPGGASGWLLNFQAAVQNTCPDTCMSNIHSEVVG